MRIKGKLILWQKHPHGEIGHDNDQAEIELTISELALQLSKQGYKLEELYWTEYKEWLEKIKLGDPPKQPSQEQSKQDKDGNPIWIKPQPKEDEMSELREKIADVLDKDLPYYLLTLRLREDLLELANKIVAILPKQVQEWCECKERAIAISNPDCCVQCNKPIKPPQPKIEPLNLPQFVEGYWKAKNRDMESMYYDLMFMEKKINELIQAINAMREERNAIL